MARTFTQHVPAWRTTAPMYSRLLALQSTFPEPEWGCMFRWVFDQPEVQDAIARRLAEGQEIRMGGADHAMARGDR